MRGLLSPLIVSSEATTAHSYLGAVTAQGDSGTKEKEKIEKEENAFQKETPNECEEMTNNPETKKVGFSLAEKTIPREKIFPFSPRADYRRRGSNARSLTASSILF